MAKAKRRSPRHIVLMLSIVLIIVFLLFVTVGSLIPSTATMTPWLAWLLDAALTIKSSMTGDYTFYMLVIIIVTVLIIPLTVYISSTRKRSTK